MLSSPFFVCVHNTGIEIKKKAVAAAAVGRARQPTRNNTNLPPPPPSSQDRLAFRAARSPDSSCVGTVHHDQRWPTTDTEAGAAQQPKQKPACVLRSRQSSSSGWLCYLKFFPPDWVTGTKPSPPLPTTSARRRRAGGARISRRRSWKNFWPLAPTPCAVPRSVG